jgi:hypothetical protein
MALAVGAGCGGAGPSPELLRDAGGHVESVGPVALLDQTPRQRRAESAETAVHLSGAGAPPAAVVPDSKIRLDLGMKLRDASLDRSGLDVDVDDQRVTLYGSIPTLRDRDRAELIARSVRGVEEVDNGLTVEATAREAAQP